MGHNFNIFPAISLLVVVKLSFVTKNFLLVKKVGLVCGMSCLFYIMKALSHCVIICLFLFLFLYLFLLMFVTGSFPAEVEILLVTYFWKFYMIIFKCYLLCI